METTNARLGVNDSTATGIPQDSTDMASLSRSTSLEETASAVGDFMTAGTALSEPFLQELLDQPLPDLQFIDSSMYLDEQQGFYWPTTML